MDAERLLLACVNTRVSLVGIDLSKHEAFWYCPSSVLRACSACYAFDALYIATDNQLTCVGRAGVRAYPLPGPHDNYAHSVKAISDEQLGLADTGNSQIRLFDGEHFTLHFSPLEEWGVDTLPPDAIHVNDFIPYEGGFLVSAFSYQPFRAWKGTSCDWQRDGLGCLFHLRPFAHRTRARILAIGLECPHSLVSYEGRVYCCASAAGDFVEFTPTERGFLQESKRVHVSSTHFLRGALRYGQGWLLGGSSTRHRAGSPGMLLYYLPDNGTPEIVWTGGVGEIYDVLPWQTKIMTMVCDQIAQLPVPADETNDYPPPCRLPESYR